MIRCTLLFLLLLAGFPLSSQLSETYFSANRPKAGGLIKDYVRTGDGCYFTSLAAHREFWAPSLSKVTPDGGVQWVVPGEVKDDYYPDETRHFILGREGFLYWFGNFTGIEELWKIDAASGAIVWKKPLPNVKATTGHLLDYGTDRLLLFFTSQAGTGRMALLDKQNGKILSEYSCLTDWKVLATDAGGNVLFSRADSLYMRSAANLSNVLWKMRIALPFYVFSNVDGFWVDSVGQTVFVFGDQDGFNGAYARVNLADGQLIHAQAIGLDVNFRDAQFRGDTLFTCWQHAFVGGGLHAYTLVAIRIPDSKPVYENTYLISQPGGPPGQTVYGAHGSLSLDLDDKGGLYLTGYCNDANYGPGAWGVVKVNASNGQKVWDALVDEDPSELDHRSSGRIAWFAGGRLNLIGELQNSFSAWLAVAEIDPADGNMLQRSIIPGRYQFPSETRRILPDTNGFWAWKQLDDCAALSRYDADLGLVWEQSYCRNLHLVAGDLYRGPDGMLYGTGVSFLFEYGNFATFSDSIYLWRIDPTTGNILREWRFPATYGYDAFPVHVQIENDLIRFLYFLNPNYYQVQIKNDQAGTPIPIDGYYAHLPPQSGETSARIEDRLYFFNSGGTGWSCDLQNGNGAAYTVAHGLNWIRALVPDTGAVGFLLGRNMQNRAAVVCRNFTADTTVWTSAGTVNGVAVRLVRDSDSTLITTGQEGKTLFVRRLSRSTGQLIWERFFNYSNWQCIPMEIVLDTAEHTVTIAGYVENPANGNREILLYKTGSDGNLRYFYVRNGDYDGDNRAFCTALLPGGKLLVGGRINHSAYKKAGFIWSNATDLFSAEGVVFADLNSNGVPDLSEPRLRETISITPGDAVIFPDSLGRFAFYVPFPGDYTAGISSPSPFYLVEPATVTLNTSQPTLSDRNIRLVPTASVYDIAVQAETIDPARLNFPTRLLLRIENLGTRTADSITVRVSCPPEVRADTLIAMGGAWGKVSLSGNPPQMTIGLSGLSPLAALSAIGLMRLNSAQPIGDTLVCQLVSSLENAQDVNPLNDTDTLRLPVVAAFDPNDITANPAGSVRESALNADGSLDVVYTIRFQNDGNAPTSFVILEDTLDDQLDPGYFRLLAGSAACNIQFPGPRQIRFVFPNYALAPFAADSVASRGFVTYQIRSAPWLNTGDTLENRAGIYFDFNPPVVTNTAQTYVVETVSTGSATEFSGWQVFPNPANGTLYISRPDSGQPEEAVLFDAAGHWLRQKTLQGTTTSMEVRGLPPGVYFLKTGSRVWKVFIR